ncbi:hypothetical protein EVAR_63839_1 [Eumeta japonica]|uniref:Uncharacterized protein n=1 Tax=Eumeta variegata TaxID=151549 RepID=A0A4C1Z8Y4_EUMVA|nr:hypothetical protein EVAR_63839_1 [Eumeta japonica]
MFKIYSTRERRETEITKRIKEQGSSFARAGVPNNAPRAPARAPSYDISVLKTLNWVHEFSGYEFRMLSYARLFIPSNGAKKWACRCRARRLGHSKLNLCCSRSYAWNFQLKEELFEKSNSRLTARFIILDPVIRAGPVLVPGLRAANEPMA